MTDGVRTPPPTAGTPAFSDLEESLIYLSASPYGVDIGTLPKEEVQQRVVYYRSLPENIRRVLFDEKTALRIYTIAVRQHQLSQAQTQDLARILRDVLTGTESPASVTTLVQQRVGVEPPTAQRISDALVREFITPNYFQISQLYERNQGKQQEPGMRNQELGIRGPATPGRPLESFGPRDDRTPRPPPTLPSAPSPRPKNLVDLRGSRQQAVGSRDEGATSSPPPTLPPTPPPAPRPSEALGEGGPRPPGAPGEGGPRPPEAPGEGGPRPSEAPGEGGPPPSPLAPPPPIPRGPLTDRPTHGPLPPVRRV